MEGSIISKEDSKNIIFNVRRNCGCCIPNSLLKDIDSKNITINVHIEKTIDMKKLGKIVSEGMKESIKNWSTAKNIKQRAQGK